MATQQQILLFEASKEGKNLHMSHVDELPILHGYEGAEYGYELLVSAFQRFESQEMTEVNVKWDGAPAVYFGTHPEENKPVLALKSFFATRSPKFIFSEEDIAKHYGEKPDLVKKLTYTWNAFAKSLNIVPAGEVWQGDLMFTPDAIESKDLKGEEHFVFQPNTILYAVKADSELGRAVAAADVGVVWHTRYRGETVDSMQATHDIAESDLTPAPGIWQITPYLSLEDLSEDLSPQFAAARTSFSQAAARTGALLSKLENVSDGYLEELGNNKILSMQLNAYINDQIRAGNITLEPKTFASQFSSYVKSKFTDRAEALRDKGRRPGEIRAAERERDALLTSLSNDAFMKALPIVISLQQSLNAMKSALLVLLQESSTGGGSLKTFLTKQDGTLEPTAHEGFVLTDPKTGKTGKAVDRLQFSRANFSPEYRKGWEGVSRST